MQNAKQTMLDALNQIEEFIMSTPSNNDSLMHSILMIARTARYKAIVGE